MKKGICLLVSLICTTVLLLSGCLGGCADLFSGGSEESIDPWEVKKEEDGFYYCYEDEQGKTVKDFSNAEYSVIIGLTDELYQTEEIVIPEKLGGCYVKCIGTMYTFWFGTDKYGINCYNSDIKKIIINHDIGVYYIDGFTGDLVLNASPKVSIDIMGNCRSVQINKDINIADLNGSFEDDDYFVHCLLYNDDKCIINFNATGGQQTTYKYLMKCDELMSEPQEPIKEGYTFAGWFKDDTCSEEWNFEIDTITENITLYAKWIEE